MLNNQSIFLSLYYIFNLFLISFFGIFWNKKNIIVLFLCVELMLFGVGLFFVFFSIYFYNIQGQIFALLLLAVGACETAIGLSIVLLAYRLNKTVSFESFFFMFG